MKIKRLYFFSLVVLLLAALLLTACYENNYYNDDWDEDSGDGWNDEDYSDSDDEEYYEEDWSDDEDDSEGGVISEIFSGFFYDEPEDCYEDEYYDEESQLCLPSDEETVSSWLDENEDSLFDDEDTYWDDTSSGDGSEQVLVTYSVSGDQISFQNEESVSGSDELNYQEDTNTHEQMWQLFASIIPADERSEISQFVIFTDGEEETLAWVEPINDDLGNWSLAVDPADSSDTDELITTFVHEYGHLLTLNEEQIIGGASTCYVYMPDEGCSRDNSYLNLFVNEFWPDDIYNEWDEIQYEEDDDTYYDLLDAFYAKYQDRFVTDYAATNPEEDIAESWTYFVLQPKPAGNTIAEQKVLFFYDFPELVALRNEISSRVVSRARRY